MRLLSTPNDEERGKCELLCQLSGVQSYGCHARRPRSLCLPLSPWPPRTDPLVTSFHSTLPPEPLGLPPSVHNSVIALILVLRHHTDAQSPPEGQRYVCVHYGLVLSNSTACTGSQANIIDPLTYANMRTFVTAIHRKGDVAVNRGVLRHKVPPPETEAQRRGQQARGVSRLASLPCSVPSPAFPAWAHRPREDLGRH